MSRRLLRAGAVAVLLACLASTVPRGGAKAAPAPPATDVHGAGGHSHAPIKNAPSGPMRYQRLHGTYHVLTTDVINGDAFDDVYRNVIELPDRLVDVTMPASSHVEPGDVVDVTGMGDDGTLAADSVAVAQRAASPAAASIVTTTGVTTVLVILATWTVPDSVTQASATDVMFTQGNKWWGENSYGALQLSGTVTPWVTIPAPSSCYPGTALMNSAKQAALAKGYNAANYNRTVVYFPGCAEASGYAGWAYVPGTSVWLNGYMDMRVAIHEQGHNYGLGHAHSYNCSSGNVQLVLSIPANCVADEYGDPFDSMGGGSYVGHFSARQKQILAWLGYKQMASTDSVDLSPIEGTTGTRAAKVTVSASRSYWLEYRAGVGEDSDFLPPPTGCRCGSSTARCRTAGPTFSTCRQAHP
jgi:hypothetical protein